jgi:hypothetical protein
MADNKKQSRNGRLSAPDVIARVRRELPELMGRPIESVLGVERDEDEGWRVTVQVVELSRVPSTTDVLGAYAVTLGEEGDLLGYRRTRRYQRNQPDEDH